jgi:hypothetical protein
LLVAWFEQATGSNTEISGSLLTEKALHIATRLGTKILQLVMAGFMVSSSDIVLHIKLYQVSTKL